MDLLSLNYLIFVVVCLIAYYLFPKKYRWTVLLAGSTFYYIFICKWYVFFLLFTIVSTYFCALGLKKLLVLENQTVKEHKEDWSRDERKAYRAKGLKKRQALLFLGIISNFGILAFLKYIPLAKSLGILLPLGISFYTFQSMGYLIDVYREKIEPEKNFFKFALFVSFFPQIIQGPIALYDELALQLYEGHKFEYEKFKRGLMLILWGALKKLVIADRAVNIINFIMDKPAEFSGSYIFLASIVYALQLYADFSGGIDMIRGVAELFGITMAENFKHPYFSRSLTEYWHRWHITLGNWCRNYIFYPLSISKKSLDFGKWLKPKFGKHIAKVLPGSIASLITFLVIGVWHGSNMKYVFFGLWNGLVIMIAELFAPINEKIAEKFFGITHLKKDGIFATIVSVVWTFLLVLVGYYFDIATNASTAFNMLYRSVFDFHITDLKLTSIVSAIDGCGLDIYDILLLLVMTLVLYIISFLGEKKQMDLRDYVLAKPLVLRWLILFVGIFTVLIFGYYGPGSNPADFVYMQF